MSLSSRPNSCLADAQRRFRAKRCEPVMSAKIWPKTAAVLRRHGRDLIVEISDLQVLRLMLANNEQRAAVLL